MIFYLKKILIQDCKQFTTADEIKKIEWSTFTGVLGNEVLGIWEKYMDKTDVNATDAYFEEKCIVTGDGTLGTHMCPYQIYKITIS